MPKLGRFSVQYRSKGNKKTYLGRFLDYGSALTKADKCPGSKIYELPNEDEPIYIAYRNEDKEDSRGNK